MAQMYKTSYGAIAIRACRFLITFLLLMFAGHALMEIFGLSAIWLPVVYFIAALMSLAAYKSFPSDRVSQPSSTLSVEDDEMFLLSHTDQIRGFGSSFGDD